MSCSQLATTCHRNGTVMQSTAGRGVAARMAVVSDDARQSQGEFVPAFEWLLNDPTAFTSLDDLAVHRKTSALAPAFLKPRGRHLEVHFEHRCRNSTVQSSWWYRRPSSAPKRAVSCRTHIRQCKGAKNSTVCTSLDTVGVGNDGKSALLSPNGQMRLLLNLE